MIRLIVLFISSLCFLNSCSVITTTNKCNVSKAALVLGKTIVTINSSYFDLTEICKNTPSCKSMSLVYRENNLYLDVLADKEGALLTSFKLGKVEDDNFINSDEELPLIYKKFQNYEIDKNGLLIKQKLDTNILFYNKNESYYSYNEFCSSKDAVLGAVAIGLTENFIK